MADDTSADDTKGLTRRHFWSQAVPSAPATSWPGPARRRRRPHLGAGTVTTGTPTTERGTGASTPGRRGARWSDPATWGGQVPGPSDVAVIDRDVLLDVDATVAGVQIAGGASLQYDPAPAAIGLVRQRGGRGTAGAAPGRRERRPPARVRRCRRGSLRGRSLRHADGHRRRPVGRRGRPRRRRRGEDRLDPPRRGRARRRHHRGGRRRHRGEVGDEVVITRPSR